MSGPRRPCLRHGPAAPTAWRQLGRMQGQAAGQVRGPCGGPATYRSPTHEISSSASRRRGGCWSAYMPKHCVPPSPHPLPLHGPRTAAGVPRPGGETHSEAHLDRASRPPGPACCSSRSRAAAPARRHSDPRNCLSQFLIAPWLAAAASCGCVVPQPRSSSPPAPPPSPGGRPEREACYLLPMN
jgi:hypothetical protein